MHTMRRSEDTEAGSSYILDLLWGLQFDAANVRHRMTMLAGQEINSRISRQSILNSCARPAKPEDSIHRIFMRTYNALLRRHRSRRQLPPRFSLGPAIQCSKCKASYDNACGTRNQQQNHQAKQIKLVCQACQARRFHPQNRDAYTCQTCKGNFGILRCVRVQCIQCIVKEQRRRRVLSHKTAEGCSLP